MECRLAWLARIYLLISVVALLFGLARLLRGCWARVVGSAGRDGAPPDGGYVPEHAIREADPLIYSQEWLIAHGLAVTWQNPDIRLERAGAPGTPVNSWELVPDTEYVVLVNVWNGSESAPAAGVVVQLSYLDFGIGGISVPVGQTEVDLPVKGALGTPAVAALGWRTPASPGHYCLQARLAWPYDAEPGNNLGQHNVDVKPFNSPVARFVVPVRNTGRWPTTVRLTVDAYALPALEPCPPPGEEPKDRAAGVRARHARDLHGLPQGWRVVLDGAEEGTVRLQAGATAQVQVALTAPDGFTGRQAVNISGFDGPRLLGGVTLIGEGSTS